MAFGAADALRVVLELPSWARETLTWAAFDHPAAEIAGLVGIGENTMWTRLRRARLMLRAKLKRRQMRGQ